MNNDKSRFSPVDLLNLGLIFVLFLFYLSAVAHSPYKWEPLAIFAFSGLLVAGAVYLRRKKNKNILLKILLFFYPLFFLFVVFESFFMIIPWFNPVTYDTLFAETDLMILGVNPTVWIERLVHPWLTDLLCLIYIIYFPMPWFLMVWLAVKKKLRELDKSVFVLLVTYYLGYLGYFFFPATGPRFYEPIMQLQQKSLDGIFLAKPIRDIIMFLEPNKFDAFPSLHIAVSLTTIMLMSKYNKRLFYIFLPVVAGIFVAVIYCRYHYFIDVVAGIEISLVAYFGGEKIHSLAFEKHLGPYYKD